MRKIMNRRMHRVYFGIFFRNFPLLGFFGAFFFLTQDILRIQNNLSLLLLQLVQPWSLPYPNPDFLKWLDYYVTSSLSSLPPLPLYLKHRPHPGRQRAYLVLHSVGMLNVYVYSSPKSSAIEYIESNTASPSPRVDSVWLGPDEAA